MGGTSALRVAAGCYPLGAAVVRAATLFATELPALL